MNEDQDLVDLRRYGALLRREVDVARLVGGVLERVRSAPTVTGWLERWFRPLVAAVVVAAVMAGTQIYRENRQAPDLVSTAETEILTEAARVLP